MRARDSTSTDAARRRARARGLILAAIASVIAAPVLAAHPNALWRVVHGVCLRDMALTGRPAPCLAVDRRRGVAVVPDLASPTQVLLVPTVRRVGIEDPALLAAGGVNYWQAAWDARRYFERRAGRPVPRDRIALAINSPFSRSQAQLHIHVDCVRADVREALTRHQGEIGSVWSPLSFFLAGHRYKARRLEGENLGGRDPFKLLARGDAFARGHMAMETLAVVGMVFADGSPGFILLSDRLDLARRAPAFAEGLLDHGCAVLREP